MRPTIGVTGSCLGASAADNRTMDSNREAPTRSELVSFAATLHPDEFRMWEAKSGRLLLSTKVRELERTEQDQQNIVFRPDGRHVAIVAHPMTTSPDSSTAV